MTGALLDRLTHHVPILEFNGDSYRLKQSKGRRRSTSTPEQNQAASTIIDPETGQIFNGCPHPPPTPKHEGDPAGSPSCRSQPEP